MIRKEDTLQVATPAADHSDYEGYAVTIASGVATVVSSATTVPDGVITEGRTTSESDDIIPFIGCDKVVEVRAGGACTNGSLGILDATGRFVDDTGSGARVKCVKFLETGTVGALLKALLFKPESAS